MPDAAEEVEKVARAVGHRRSGEQVDLWRADHRRTGIVGHAQQLQDVRGALGVVLDEVSLVEDHARPANRMKPGCMGLEQIVVDDNPARRTNVFWSIGSAADHLDRRFGIDEPDLSPPVELQRGRADHQDRALGRGDLHGHDRLARLPEPHVVGENRSPFRHQEDHAVRLVRIEQALRKPADGVEVWNGKWERRHQTSTSWS